MPPVIDDAARLAMGAFNDALMGANDLPLGNDNQLLGIDVQADSAVREAGGHRVAVAIEGDQACGRHPLAQFNKAVKCCC